MGPDNSAALSLATLPWPLHFKTPPSSRESGNVAARPFCTAPGALQVSLRSPQGGLESRRGFLLCPCGATPSQGHPGRPAGPLSTVRSPSKGTKMHQRVNPQRPLGPGVSCNAASPRRTWEGASCGRRASWPHAPPTPGRRRVWGRVLPHPRRVVSEEVTLQTRSLRGKGTGRDEDQQIRVSPAPPSARGEPARGGEPFLVAPINRTHRVAALRMQTWRAVHRGIIAHKT